MDDLILNNTSNIGDLDSSSELTEEGVSQQILNPTALNPFLNDIVKPLWLMKISSRIG